MMTDKPRKPAAFRLDDPDLSIAETAPSRTNAGHIVLTPAPQPLEQSAPDIAPPKRWRLGGLFWSAMGALASLIVTVSLWRFIDDLFARASWLGWVGLGLSALVGITALVIVGREIAALFRLEKAERLRAQAIEILVSDDRNKGRALVDDLIAFTASQPAQARARAELASHREAIIDGADLVRLAERALMVVPDAQVRNEIATAAKRVSVVTALSPRALFDVLFVAVSVARLVRRIAAAYGTRPGALGLMRLMRLTVVHLTVTGGLAATDSLLQQLLGHGIAAKLSARLGEGVLNGLLTARLGLAAQEVCRPLPFTALPAPGVSDVAGDLVVSPDGQSKESR